ncbi:hypothetical protein C7445_103161 [Alicyclobacillus sacchari]|uniref:Uncharacterized protein n=1 Tax=Alicyclobacillus sacchari TaxID=392010 RepID=A0A4R8LU46_9BACL|nr:hypothetical protein [Alicyclobacillus sacchari]TDY50116.1 hypothetical protein C7445_103161 [Alicyclobacillus sacchari]GMA57522.1 hypothetical protein GCM10025858_20250 [Alicyclobacillus sacchari]
MKSKFVFSCLGVIGSLLVMASPAYAAAANHDAPVASPATATTSTANPSFGFLPDWPDDDWE